MGGAMMMISPDCYYRFFQREAVSLNNLPELVSKFNNPLLLFCRSRKLYLRWIDNVSLVSQYISKHCVSPILCYFFLALPEGHFKEIPQDTMDLPHYLNNVEKINSCFNIYLLHL